MIDNFEQISNLLKFEDTGDFYFVQILQRKKEHPELGNNSRVIKCYYIHSLEHLNHHKNEIIKLAQVFGARVYIHLNRRNSKRIAFEMAEDLIKRLKDNQIEGISKIYESTCGKHGSEKNISWVVDIDNKDRKYIDEVIKIIEDSEPLGKTKLLELIETLNGYHVISRPFNSKEFGKIYPKIEIHKNNPSVLFIP
jgi:hypothetical protein